MKTLAEQLGFTQEEAGAIATLGADLLNAGNTADARILFEGLTRLNPGDAAMWLALGEVHRTDSRVDEARQAFQRALAIQPGQPQALAALATLGPAAV